MRIIATITAVLTLAGSLAAQSVQSMHSMVIARKNAVAATPTWGGEIQRFSGNMSSSVFVVTLTGGIAAGDRAVVPLFTAGGAGLTYAVTDSRGNSWSQLRVQNFSTSRYVSVHSAHVGTALQSGDTITVTVTGSTVGNIAGVVAYATDCALTQPNQSASATAFGSSLSATASTTKQALMVGIVSLTGVSQTLNTSAWSVSGAAQDYTTVSRLYYLYQAAAAGSQNPNITLSGGSTTIAVAWAALE